MAYKATVYLNGMTIGHIQDDRFSREAKALTETLVNCFVGKVERSFPFKDREHEIISLFPFGDNNVHSRFVQSRPERA